MYQIFPAETTGRLELICHCTSPLSHDRSEVYHTTLFNERSLPWTLNGYWLGWLDLNQWNDGVKVRCLTAWLHPSIKADYENWTHTHKPTTMRTLCLHIVLSVLPDSTERKLKNKLSKGLTSFGVPDGIWTHDPSIKSALLYHLSYEYKFYLSDLSCFRKW